jgi:hypothetical protein
MVLFAVLKDGWDGKKSVTIASFVIFSVLAHTKVIYEYIEDKA